MGRKFFVGGNFKMLDNNFKVSWLSAHIDRNGTIKSIKEIVHNLSSAKLGAFIITLYLDPCRNQGQATTCAQQVVQTFHETIILTRL
jgi:hypothetical protein